MIQVGQNEFWSIEMWIGIIYVISLDVASNIMALNKKFLQRMNFLITFKRRWKGKEVHPVCTQVEFMGQEIKPGCQIPTQCVEHMITYIIRWYMNDIWSVWVQISHSI